MPTHYGSNVLDAHRHVFAAHSLAYLLYGFCCKALRSMAWLKLPNHIILNTEEATSKQMAATEISHLSTTAGKGKHNVHWKLNACRMSVDKNGSLWRENTGLHAQQKTWHMANAWLNPTDLKRCIDFVRAHCTRRDCINLEREPEIPATVEWHF